MQNQPLMFLERIRDLLSMERKYALCVSGGVDSITMAKVFHHLVPVANLVVVHAISPAVPARDTKDVRNFCNDNEMFLREVMTEELMNENYTSNPVNRCYYCKFNLFTEIQALFPDHKLVTGTNLDDESDYRPGLIAAERHQVMEPLRDAGLTKDDVRRLASFFGLSHFSRKPASPCLASRVETGVRLSGPSLLEIDRLETAVRQVIGDATIRLRLRAEGYVLEIDEVTFLNLDQATIREIKRIINAEATRESLIDITSYHPGSATVFP